MSYQITPLLQAYAVRSTQLATAARVLTVQLLGGGPEGGDPEAETIDGAEVIQPLGLFARPYLTPRTEGFAFELGDEVVCIGLIDKSATPFTDVAEGETRLYGAKEARSRIRISPAGDITVETAPNRILDVTHPSGAHVRVNANGSIDLISAGGQDLTLNVPAGGLKVARATDPVTVDAALKAAVQAMILAFNVAPPAPMMSGAGSIPLYPGPLAGTIASTAGAANVKA